MNFWIIIAVLGFIFTLAGIILFMKNYHPGKKMPNTNLMLGFLLPLGLAFLYSESVIEMIPQITLMDLSAFFIMGMISGIFLSLILIQRKALFNREK